MVRESETLLENKDVQEMKLLRVPDAGALLGFKSTKIYQLIESGRLKSLKIDGARRISLGHIREFLAAQSSGSDA